jgi:hypothetical protein
MGHDKVYIPLKSDTNMVFENALRQGAALDYYEKYLAGKITEDSIKKHPRFYSLGKELYELINGAGGSLPKRKAVAKENTEKAGSLEQLAGRIKSIASRRGTVTGKVTCHFPTGGDGSSNVTRTYNFGGYEFTERCGFMDKPDAERFASDSIETAKQELGAFLPGYDISTLGNWLCITAPKNAGKK